MVAIINVYFIFTHTFGGRVGAKNPLLGQTQKQHLMLAITARILAIIVIIV